MLDDLLGGVFRADGGRVDTNIGRLGRFVGAVDAGEIFELAAARFLVEPLHIARLGDLDRRIDEDFDELAVRDRSEEHTSELQSLMRISYAVFCLKKKKTTNTYTIYEYKNDI